AAWPDSPAEVLVAGDVRDAAHRRALVDAAGPRLDLLLNKPSAPGAGPPLDERRRVYEVNVFAPPALVQEALPRLRPGAVVLNISSDAAVEAYEGWGGYGSSKAALDQLSAVLAAERPDLRV